MVNYAEVDKLQENIQVSCKKLKKQKLYQDYTVNVESSQAYSK